MSSFALPSRNDYIPTDFSLRSGIEDASNDTAEAAQATQAAAALLKGMSLQAEKVSHRTCLSKYIESLHSVVHASLILHHLATGFVSYMAPGFWDGQPLLSMFPFE